LELKQGASQKVTKCYKYNKKDHAVERGLVRISNVAEIIFSTNLGFE
jgi:hypothetical protein